MSRFRFGGSLIPAVCFLLLPAALRADGAPKVAGDDDRLVDKQRTVVVEHGAPGDAFWVGEGGPMRFKIDESMGRGFLGVSLLDLTPELRAHFGVPEDTGVMVSQVEADSPAAKAGLKAGDILTGVDGEDLKSSFDVGRAVRRKKDGEVIALEIYRDGKLQKLTATASEKERRVVDVRGLPRKMMSPAEMAAMDEAMRTVRERVNQIGSDPAMRDKIMVLRSAREAELEKRLADLEKRLAELQKQIDNRNR
jgi:membrane-associated protease RseP (regulator of RpoE activity)